MQNMQILGVSPPFKPPNFTFLYCHMKLEFFEIFYVFVSLQQKLKSKNC